ncbi:uncharacterized protein LOC132743301 isoform X2 [Ruditapes philippinarum]|uniref:uncharacterized protein LOC132743301 isoform X2 n=1 Tax=Ruditapes philippinarum TaxID=129788 RepID=UPI00295BE628|nr:uncharacterized protein LOC132743301 isoform X2 [Ruditapes philippinarum]
MKFMIKMAGSLPWQRCSIVHPASLAKHPQTWTKEEIGAWLSWCTEEYSIEPIPSDKFDLNGKALCLLSRSDFMERVPRNGDVLYNCLQTLISKHAGSGVLFHPGLPGTSTVQDAYQPFTGGQRSSISTSIAKQISPGPSSLLEQRPLGIEHSLESLRHDSSSDCRLLWEFIYQLLSNTKYSNYVCWEDKDEYVFRINNPTGLAELWGQQKNRTNMTYEKLSRALRYYYRMNIIKKVQGKRLTYRFLQPPSCIQKGQRGAKPHYKIQMDMILEQRSQQSIKKDPESPVSSGATATASYSPSIEEGYKSSNDDLDELESDNSSNVIGSSRSSPGAMISSEMENKAERSDNADALLSRTSSVSSQTMSRSLFSSQIQFQHGIKHPPYPVMPPLSEQRFIPVVKHETQSAYTSSHTLQRERFLLHPRDAIHPILHGVKSEHERMKVPAMQFLEKNVRYQEGIHRSLSSDFAQSLQVQQYALRPTQPRSVSPRTDVQEEPQDLTTRKRARSTIDPPTESQRPQSFHFTGYSSGKSEMGPGADSPTTCHESI